MYINATSICKAAKKVINDWKRRLETQAYLQAISSEVNILPSELVKYETGSVSSTVGIPTVELIRQYKGGNNNRQTWGHRRVAINIVHVRTCSYIYSPSI